MQKRKQRAPNMGKNSKGYTAKMWKEYGEAIGNASAMAFIHVIHRNKDATFGDLAPLAVELDLTHLTVEQCFGTAIPTNEKGWSKLLGRRAAPQWKALPPAARTRQKTVKQVNPTTRKAILDILTACGNGKAWSTWLTHVNLLKASGLDKDEFNDVMDTLVTNGDVHRRENTRGAIRYKLSKVVG